MDDEIFDGNDNVEESTDNQPEKDVADNKGSSISADLIRGHINTIILRTLYERDKYGYEIINEIEQKSHGQYTLKQPTLYSALKRLEGQGYIKAYWKTDYVTLGGRRKYFTLTELGKDFAEKNQSEWEYSRTVIDSLISDKSFDFSQPAPTPVDFNILKKSVTRVRTSSTVDAGAENSDTAQPSDLAEAAQDDAFNNFSEQSPVAEAADEQNYSTDIPPTQADTVQQPEQQIYAQQFTQPEEPEQQTYAQPQYGDDIPSRVDTRTEEERRIAHENYLRLISSDSKLKSEPEEAPIVPNSDEIDTEKLIYNNKPETERDYKKLVNNIFSKAIKSAPPKKQTAPAPQPAQALAKEPVVTFANPGIDPALEKGQADGLKVNTTSYSTARVTNAKNTTYNVGATLFKCSSVIGIIMLLEFIFCLIFVDSLEVGIGYPFVILLLALAQFAIFAVLMWSGYGKNSARPTSHNYLSVTIILTIILILIVCLFAFLLNVNVQSASDIMAKIVVPILVTLNIPIFAAVFRLFCKYLK